MSSSTAVPASSSSQTGSPVVTQFSTLTVPVPSLSASGWVYATAEKASLLMAHFFESDYLQSYLYRGKISNIQQLIQEYGNDIINFQSQLTSALELYLGRYYQVANVRVTTSDNTGTLAGSVNVSIQADVTENGNTYSIGKLVSINNSIVRTVVNLNDFGTATGT